MCTCGIPVWREYRILKERVQNWAQHLKSLTVILFGLESSIAHYPLDGNIGVQAPRELEKQEIMPET